MNVKINAINPIDNSDIFTHEKELKSCYEFPWQINSSAEKREFEMKEIATGHVM